MILPTELYRLIIQHVATRVDLHKLLFVSRTVSYETEPVLYHAIEITDRMRASMGLLRHLARCYRVARYVRELGIYGRITLASLTEAQIPSPNQYWHTLNEALYALKNLRVLGVSTYIVTPPYIAIPPTSIIFSNCTFKLEVFRLANYAERSLPHLDLSQVKELHLGGMAPTFTINGISPEVLPSLCILSSHRSQLLQLLESSTDTILRIKALEFFYSNLYFETKAPNITSLMLHFVPDRCIRSFPSLRYLMSKMDEDFSTLVDTLSILKGLEKLCLINAESFVYPADLHVKLFSAISSLQELDIAEALDTSGLRTKGALEVPSKERQAQRWNRNAMNHRYVLVDVNEWKGRRWLQ